MKVKRVILFDWVVDRHANWIGQSPKESNLLPVLHRNCHNL